MGRKKSAGPAPWQKTPIPTVLVSQGYAPLPYETHPIDTTTTPQGWGPFQVPWQQVDFPDRAVNIDCGFSKGDNQHRFAPAYGNVTLFDDPSLDRVENSSLVASIRTALGDAQRGMSSTISNSTTVAGTANRIAAALGLRPRSVAAPAAPTNGVIMSPLARGKR